MVLVCLGFLPESIVIKADPLTMRSFPTFARCMCVKQSTTTPYNPHGNTQCEQFNHTLFGLMQTLNSEQKPNWPVYLPSLVYAYNTTPHASTGFQPHELMFGHKASLPCDNWLGLENYKPDSFKSKTVWLNQQLNAMLHANKKALKS